MKKKTKTKSIKKLLKKIKKPTLKGIQSLLWEECRRIVRARYILPDQTYRCFTCDKVIAGSQVQTGHFIPRSTGGILLKYNLDNIRLQCYTCNIDGGGQGAEFYRRLVIEKGQEYVDNIFELKKQMSNFKPLEYYSQLLEKYKQL